MSRGRSVGLKTLEIIEQEGLVENAKQMGIRLLVGRDFANKLQQVA